MPYTTDNRWSAGASGATVPDDAPAAYSARWIDMGDHTPADVLPDRQGFAYNDTGYRDDLIDALTKAGESFRTPRTIGLNQDDLTTVVQNTPLWKAYMRRAGGYIYVDAWLQPQPPAADADAVCPECGHPSTAHYAIRNAAPTGVGHCGEHTGCEVCDAELDADDIRLDRGSVEAINKVTERNER